jgi:hypothetical protein
MVLIAIVMASAEAVMAVGARGHSGLATADVITLLVGQAPEFSALGANVMAMPAWFVIGVVGLALAHIFRARRMRRRRSAIRPL